MLSDLLSSVRELVALARARPGQITMASAGSGFNNHLAGERFQLQAGVRFVHVPYKGSGPARVDLMGGHVDIMFDQMSSSAPFITSGKLRPLGVTTRERSSLLPEVPTIHESGYPGFEAATYTGAMLPAGRFLYEHAVEPMGQFAPENVERWLKKTFPERYAQGHALTPVTMVQAPEDFIIVVLGGAGKHSAYLPTFGTTRAVTHPLRTADGRMARSIDDLHSR